MNKKACLIALVLRNVQTSSSKSNLIAKKVMLQLQSILQYFYKLLMWQIFINFSIIPSLTSYSYLLMII